VEDLSLNDGKWHHFVLVYDSVVPIMSIYVDGTNETNAYDNTDPATPDDWTANLGIGARNVGGTAEYFTEGTMDDLRIYTRALSSSEVQALYNATKPVAGYVPTLGTEETSPNAPPSITITDPKNQTYSTSSIPVDVNTSDPDDDDYICNISDDGNKIGETNQTSETYTDTLTKLEGSHTLSVDCADNQSNTNSKSVAYTVDLPPRWDNQTQEKDKMLNGSKNILSAQGKDADGLDWAWLETNQSGTMEKETGRETKDYYYDIYEWDNYGNLWAGRGNNTTLSPGIYRSRNNGNTWNKVWDYGSNTTAIRTLFNRPT